MEFELDGTLKEWAKDKPLSVLQLDPADRAVLRIADERDAIQKKTFTKWVNKHLKKASRHVGDLFQDLRDGHNLITLLEVLSGEHLPRETSGSMRFHMLDNVRIALRFLQCKNIKLVNIQAEDIVDGNPKLTLGLIWTIILHFQISDIVVGQESHVTAKEALLRWARRSTARYPGVRVSDFTASWRDGLAFSALVHRNRPDLIDWRNARSWQPRERLERVFSIAEHEYNVTRLLDPEDVDTTEPDEKSLITYISSLYDVFPEPPAIHPLYDAEAQRRLEEYRQLASSFHLWLREKMCLIQDRYFPPTLLEMKKLEAGSIKFKNDEVPSRHRDKQRLSHIYRELHKYFESIGERDLESELELESLDKSWAQLMVIQEERDQAITEEIKRLEWLQRLAEKVHREIKACDGSLEELERRVKEESRRLERLHPLDAKDVVDLLEQDIQSFEVQIQSIFVDVRSLIDGRYTQATELHQRFQRLDQRWAELCSLLHKQLLQPLSIVSFPVEERVVTKHRIKVNETRIVDTNPHFRVLNDCIDWCKARLKQLAEASYGSDLAGVKIELKAQLQEHKQLEQFRIQVDKCAQVKTSFYSDELSLYNDHLTRLYKIYEELLDLSTKRTADLETLHDFVQSATGELVWLNAKEEIELSRDWSDKMLDIDSLEQYYECLMSDLEKREIQFSAVQDRGECLVLQHHPASKTIEAYMSAMQSQWAWLLQLTLCLEVHLKNASHSQQFFKELQYSERWISEKDEKLNSTYSMSEFSLDEGENLLKGMQDLREELNNYGDHIHKLVQQAKEIVPMKQRRQPVVRPIEVTCICSYKQVNMAIEKNEHCTLYDNSGRVKWRVKNSQGIESPVPGVCFMLHPPDEEATDAAEKLRRQYERNVNLWQRKQLRLRQNMIFATIKVVKDWNLQQFLDMGQEQRTAIRKALNEDANKLLTEGDPSDPQLRRLRREMAEVNRLFDDFEKRAHAEEESRNAGRIFTEQASLLQQTLDDAEKLLNIRIAAPLPREVDSLSSFVLEHKDYEESMHRLTPELERLQQIFRGISLKTPQMKNRLDTITEKWNTFWDLSNLYIKRLKFLEVVLIGIEENASALIEFESKLASLIEIPSDITGLQNTLEDLMVLQNAIAQQQILIDQLNDDTHNARRFVEKSRLNHCGPHGDLEKLDLEINKINTRWSNICRQLVDRLRNAEIAYGLAQQNQTSFKNETDFVDKNYDTLECLAPISTNYQELDTTKNLFNKVVERAPVIETVNITAECILRESKQAVKEKFKLCKETLFQLLEWIAKTENTLAHQAVVNEDFDELGNQINSLKKTKEDIEAHNQPVLACLDQIRQIVLTSSDVLSSEEMSSLENSRSLKLRFDIALERTERLLKRLISARDELGKFKKETSSFINWLDNSYHVLREKECCLTSLSSLNIISSSSEDSRDFMSDVIAHQADLRFITMSAQKFVDESKKYLQSLNELRTSLPQRFSHKEPISSQDSAVRSEVSLVTSQYKELLGRATTLSDKLTALGSRQQNYREALDKAVSWLQEFEPRAQQLLTEAAAHEPKHIEEQLTHIKTLYAEALANEQLVSLAISSLQALLQSLNGRLALNERELLESPVRTLQERHVQLTKSLIDRCRDLDAALLQSQGVQDALESLVVWLNTAEVRFKSICRPASLQRERLEEQLREQRLLQAELESHQASVKALTEKGQKLLLNGAAGARTAKRFETKLSDVQIRFEKLCERSERRGEFLDEVAQSLESFLTENTKFGVWCTQMIELLTSRDLTRLELSEYGARIIRLSDQRDDQRTDYENLIRAGKILTAKKDVSEGALIRDKIKAAEAQWKELTVLLDEKQRLNKSRTERLAAYEKLHNQLLDWLTRTENRVQKLQPVAVDLEKLRVQIDELKPFQKEYKDFGNTVDKLNDLGIAYDNLTKDRSESPTRRRTSTSPTKRQNTTNQLRRMSQDDRSPSPSKTAQSPVSPNGSSGFSSRRSSQDGFHLEELSLVQQQLSEINNRYELLGVKLSDRQTELDNIKEELRKYLDNLRILKQFLDKIQRQLPKDLIPVTRTDSDKVIKQFKTVVEEMYEKQSLLDSTKSQVRDLVRRKSGSDGVDTLNHELEDMVHRWKSISEKCKEKIDFLEDIKKLYDTYDGLSSWLGAKEKMLSALGPISSDPRMVASQVQQVQVLKEEFRTQQPQLDHLVEVSDKVLSRLIADSSDAQQIRYKLKSILQRWSDQLNRLEERAHSLGDAVDTSREFDASLSRLRNALQGISDNLDELPHDKDAEEQLRKIENLERQLEGQRPLLADAESAGRQLCEVLSDPASRSDIQAKILSVEKFYSNLQKKLDHKKAEIEGNLRDERQFEASCSKILGWIADELSNMSEKLLVSADHEVLQQQVDHHEPVYKNVMSKEHEVIMLLNKGRDTAQVLKSQKIENRNLHRDLDKMQLQWERLKKETLERQTKLRTCAEHCKKYYRAQNIFLPWLRQADDKLESLKPGSFKRKDIDKQLKELTIFRNEVWKKSGELENNNTLGETFLSACDIDKDIVKNELNTMKIKWDKLNNDFLKRTQSLEDTARHLADFNENLRELEHGLERCEDKLASHDALGGDAKDPKLLDRIKNLREETTALKKPLLAARQQATDLVHNAGEQGVDASHLLDEVDSIVDRIEDLQAKLDDRCNELQSAATAVAQFTDMLRNLTQELLSLEKELESIRAPGREMKIVREQIEKNRLLLRNVNHLSREVEKLIHSGENLVDMGFVTDSVIIRQQVETLRKQLKKIEEKAHSQEDDLSRLLEKLQRFCQAYNEVMDDISNVSGLVSQLKPVSSEVDSIRNQQDDFKVFKDNQIEPISRTVDLINSLGQTLIQTACRDVNTSSIEKDLDKMNEKWNELKAKLNERDRKLDVGLLQSGKFQEALGGLEKWLSDTEEMVANQKPPSSDYKVVKAQLQEQKFLSKMLFDRQNSMSSLYNMGQEVAGVAELEDRKIIERQLTSLMSRFESLNRAAAERMQGLECAMNAACRFEKKLGPLISWLEYAERKIRDMELVPTDEEKIQNRILEHEQLHQEILGHKTDFSELTELARSLMAFIGGEEATALANTLQEVVDRYTTLVAQSESLNELLERSRQALRHLVLSYQDIRTWMEQIENQLSKQRMLAWQIERLHQQIGELTHVVEEINSRQTNLDDTAESGLELMRHISADEALQLKEKLDCLQRRHSDLVLRGSELLQRAQEALPLACQFQENRTDLLDWMQGAETTLQAAEAREEEILRLELELTEQRGLLERINTLAGQLSQTTGGGVIGITSNSKISMTTGTAESNAVGLEASVSRDNRRFEAIAEQIQRRAERIQLGKQRSLELIGDIDELLEWFREADSQLRDAEPPSSEPEIVRVQLREHRALNEDISGQRARLRDLLSSARRLMREQGPQPAEEIITLRGRVEELREMAETVATLSAERLTALEQALPLAEHLRDTHASLCAWLDETEQQVTTLPMPALRPELISLQQDRNAMLLQSITEHRPLVDKLTKTGEALSRLCNTEEAAKIQELLEVVSTRYLALRAELRARQQSLEQALQESSQFSDKLEGMLRALTDTAEQLQAAEPVSAHPIRLRDQIEENAVLVEELAQRADALSTVRRAAADVMSKAANCSDPAAVDIGRKLERLDKLWTELQSATRDRSHSLDEALTVAERFWSELSGVIGALAEMQDALSAQAPPAAQPAAIEQQQLALHEIRQEMDQTKPEVEQVRQSGQELMSLCGEPDKPEVRKHIEDLDQVWDNVTALYARREENLIDAMEKAMEFHGTLAELIEFLADAEECFTNLGPLGSDIDDVKRQITELSNFKGDVDPHMVKVEALNRQAGELTERTSLEQAQAIKEPLSHVNRRWEALLRGLVDRQRLLEKALLRLGQFQHALNELLVWINKSQESLESLKAVTGEAQIIEVELAKLKVLVNDIQAHQTSVDTLNDAGRQLIEEGRGSVEASSTADKLCTLNFRWSELLRQAGDKQRELEDALHEAQNFSAEIQDLISWLGEIDQAIVASKPVGGLPETATEQLERFMELYNDLEQSRAKVEAALQQGQEYQRRMLGPNAPGANLSHSLRALKQRWDSVTSRAGDKKIKLEIALKEAREFHEALQSFVDWLSGAEKLLASLKPVSRVMENILSQVDEHKAFQKDVGLHRESMLNLDKKGTHLKYFSQKQDVILIKNLLVSVQHRWERVVSKSAERTRALDHGYKEAREFNDSWSTIMTWLEETERGLDEASADGLGANEPNVIKTRLQRHRDIQREIVAKQPHYDTTMKSGRALKERAPKSDEPVLRELLTELKARWTSVCSKSVERQRKLEEALLYSGQFKEAVQVLLDWLGKSERQLAIVCPLHGDLDTVTGLFEKHRGFERDRESRALQMESVMRTGRELEGKACQEDAYAINQRLSNLQDLWESVAKLSTEKTARLEKAFADAERLHKEVHVLLEWLSDAEIRLRFANQLAEDEHESQNQLFEHEAFQKELESKEIDKNEILQLASDILAQSHPDGAIVIKQWISIIQSRWEEIATWAHQRNQRLKDHMRTIQDLENLLDELLEWLEGLENTLMALGSESLSDDKNVLEVLIFEHREFMENTAKRQNEVDRVCKTRQIKPVKDSRRFSKGKPGTLSRTSPGREKTPDSLLPHIGPRFPPKGSKGAEPEFHKPRVKLLWDRWRNVWMLAWERQRCLQDKLNYIEELDKVANFSWEDWRKRFLKFMNHKKSRLTDLFRKMDKNNDGLIPRDDFIQGLLNTKFDTSRLEMGAVADLFDRHGEGLIDWKEFIAALRPDWEERRTHNDTDKIHDEVKRLVMLCTCRQKFRVFQVGEGKYRFGDSQKLRLVRILRSTVMVRVGGGWVALDEFLVKNDPCRAKGRTNIELREQFILADGVSQSMTAFRSKPSPTSTLQRNQLSSAGPITKVRERSIRSVPMQINQNRLSRNSISAGTPDSLSDNEGSFRTLTKKTSNISYRNTVTSGGSRPSSRPASRPASRSGSRPASRQGSKPSSRYGSTHSLDSTDETGTPSRIPLRTSTSGNTPSSSRRNSVSSKRLSVSAVNGSSSRPRTPTGLITSSATSSSRTSLINRASSIPSLSAAGTSKRSSSARTSSTTNIPTAVKHTGKMKIVSSSSSTALPPALKTTRKLPCSSLDPTEAAPLQRKEKTALDEQKTPFRL